MSQNKARKTLFIQYVLLFTVEERPAEAVRPLRPQRYNIFSEYTNNCTKNRKKSMFFYLKSRKREQNAQGLSAYAPSQKEEAAD